MNRLFLLTTTNANERRPENWRDIPCSWVGKIRKMSVVLQIIYVSIGLITVFIKIPGSFLVDRQNFLKSMWKDKGTRIAWTTWKIIKEWDYHILRII